MKPTQEIDLHDYDNPIKSVDGKVPYNGYLWPTESWWPGHEDQFRNRIAGRWMFGIVALIDGRFSVDGMVGYIERNTDNPYPIKGDDYAGKPVVFATRTEAIRIAAARMIMDIRSAAYRKPSEYQVERIDRETAAEVINWTRQVVAAECNAPKLSTPIAMIPPAPTPTGLELIDYINTKDHAEKLKRKTS